MKHALIAVLACLCCVVSVLSGDEDKAEDSIQHQLSVLKQSHATYAKNEAPSRSNLFYKLCFDLDIYSRCAPVSKAEVKKWLGQADLPPDDSWHMDNLTYLWYNDRASTTWAVTLCFSNNAVASVGYRPADADLLKTIKRVKEISKKVSQQSDGDTTSEPAPSAAQSKW